MIPIPHITRLVRPGLAVGFLMSFVVSYGAEELPALDAVLARNVQALGGRAALEKVRSRTILGEASSSMMPSAASWHYYAKKPDKRLSEVEVPGWGSVLDGFDGKVAWLKNPGMAAVERSGAELAKVRREAVFDRDLELKRLYPGLAVKGLETAAGEQTVLLEAKQADGSLDRFYFSLKSGLLVRQDSEVTEGGNKTTTSALFEDYRPIDGIQIPFLMRVTAGSGGMDMNITIKLKEVKQNLEIADSKFAKPAD
jgi:hypothetical protein